MAEHGTLINFTRSDIRRGQHLWSVLIRNKWPKPQDRPNETLLRSKLYCCMVLCYRYWLALIGSHAASFKWPLIVSRPVCACVSICSQLRC